MTVIKIECLRVFLTTAKSVGFAIKGNPDSFRCDQMFGFKFRVLSAHFRRVLPDQRLLTRNDTLALLPASLEKPRRSATAHM